MEIDSINSFSSAFDEYDVDSLNSEMIPNGISKPVNSAEVDQSAIYIHKGSPKAAFRKFAAENNQKLQFVDQDTLIGQFNAGALQQQVIQKKIDPNTLIHKAILENSPVVLAFLLKHHVDVDYPDAKGMSPLTIAILSQQPKIVKLLLENGANVSPEVKWNDMSLLEISMKAKDVESMEFLVQFGADVNSSFKNGQTPVDIAMNEFYETGKFNLLNTLLNSKLLSSDMLDNAFCRVSQSFGKEGDDMLVKLLQKGANINAGNGQALAHACLNHHQGPLALNRINLLLSNGANVNLSHQLLIYMVDNLSIMKKMLELGANPNELQLMGKDKDGNPMYRDALSTAISSGSAETALQRVKLLVEAGADINRKTYGKTPLEHALEKGRMDVVKYLLEQINND